MRVLVVEDDPKIAGALKRGLMAEAFAVDVAMDGEAGADLALTEAYDVMILDWMLPGRDGPEIVRTVRGAGIVTPVLMLTAKDQVMDKVAGLGVGADDYLTKPFAFAELVARVRALLRRPAILQGDLLQAADLTLHTASHDVDRHGQPIALTAKEYAVLEYLLRHRGRPVTKDELIQHVWDFEADVVPNTVEVCVGSLRRKVDAPFGGEPVITTVRGHGYRIG